MYNILIIGYGVVGKNLEKELKKLSPDILDKYKPEVNRLSHSTYDIAFICVNTPFAKDNHCDYSEVVNAINENKDKMKEEGIFVIKSTILPGTTDKIKEETNQKVIFSPEYYGGTQHNKNYNFDFTILGGEKEYCIKAIQFFRRFMMAETDLESLTAKLQSLSNTWKMLGLLPKYPSAANSLK